MGKELCDIVEEGYEDIIDWNALQGYVKNDKKKSNKKNYLALYHI